MNLTMKKVLFYILLVLSSFLFASQLWAVEIGITEGIPGVCEGTPDADGVINCNVPKGFWLVSALFGSIIKYFTFIALLSAVLFIVINGILYSMAGMNDSLKSSSKERIIKTLIGLVILLLSGVILNAVAPWIYK